MNNAERKMAKLGRLQGQIDDLTDEMSRSLTDHIGEDYFITYDRSDGWLIVCSATSNQSKVGWGFGIGELFKMSPEEAKQAIDNAGFN